MLESLMKLNQNPLYIKEQYVHKRRAKWKNHILTPFIYIIFFYAVPICLSIVIRFNDFFDAEDFIKWFFSLVVIMVGLFFSFKSASTAIALISRERENKTFTALLGTMMTSADIFTGNFWIAFAPTAIELTCFFPSIIIAGFFLKFNLLPLYLAYIFILIFIAFFAVTGVYCSSDSNNLWEARDKMTGILLYIFVGFTGAALLVAVAAGFILPFSAWITVPVLFILTSFNPLINLAVLSYVASIPPDMPAIIILTALGHLILGAVVYWIIGRHFYRKAVE